MSGTADGSWPRKESYNWTEVSEKIGVTKNLKRQNWQVNCDLSKTAIKKMIGQKRCYMGIDKWVLWPTGQVFSRGPNIGLSRVKSDQLWRGILTKMYLCTGFSQNTLAEYTSGYIVGTYINSDWVEHKSRHKKTRRHKGCGWLDPRRGSKY